MPGLNRTFSTFLASLILWLASTCVFANDPPRDPFTGENIDPGLRHALEVALSQRELAFDDHYDAQTWMLAMSSRLEPMVPDETERFELLKLIHTEATLAGLEPEIVLAVIEVESRFDPYAISRVGAQGMMQVMPFWKNELGRSDDNLVKTTTNLRYGCTILKYYLDMEKGDIRRALARYNGSTGKNWYPDRVFRAYNGRWKGGKL